MGYHNPIPSLDDKEQSKKVMFTCSFEEPVTVEEAAQYLTEYFKTNPVTTTCIRLIGDVTVRHELPQPFKLGDIYDELNTLGLSGMVEHKETGAKGVFLMNDVENGTKVLISFQEIGGIHDDPDHSKFTLTRENHKEVIKDIMREYKTILVG